MTTETQINSDTIPDISLALKNKDWELLTKSLEVSWAVDPATKHHLFELCILSDPPLHIFSNLLKSYVTATVYQFGQGRTPQELLEHRELRKELITANAFASYCFCIDVNLNPGKLKYVLTAYHIFKDLTQYGMTMYEEAAYNGQTILSEDLLVEVIINKLGFNSKIFNLNDILKCDDYNDLTMLSNLICSHGHTKELIELFNYVVLEISPCNSLISLTSGITHRDQYKNIIRCMLFTQIGSNILRPEVLPYIDTISKILNKLKISFKEKC